MTTANPPPLNVIAARVGETLRARGQTVAVAESSAGGLVSAALLAIPGASAFFLGGAVVYSRRAGKALMGLTADDMAGMRAETEPYARMMAARVRAMHRASWGLCESGAAGPSGSPYGDAAGHVCVAVAGADVDALASRTLATGIAERATNMDLFARALLQQFEEVLQQQAASSAP
ncbi:CinA family protein [Xenophilus arseniciresistens]|uniref:CinA family protein n=1 Tax=Xenophilus arseniciresistens TaxID=1283306 RepID=A0AAE3ND47_9BURK|nr:CinA family protein [Xenophilus arseniciresistens]MDA7419038.1 CinA family protein [Xenophilus arseniciresistens]